MIRIIQLNQLNETTIPDNSMMCTWSKGGDEDNDGDTVRVIEISVEQFLISLNTKTKIIQINQKGRIRSSI